MVGELSSPNYGYTGAMMQLFCLAVIDHVQVQQAWSGLFNATLLASGIGLSYYNSGSGIYSSRNILNTTYNPSYGAKSMLLSATVPVLPLTQRVPSSSEPPSDIATSIQTLTYSPKPIPALSMYSDSARTVTFSPNVNKTGQLHVSYGRINCQATFEVLKTYPSEVFGLIAFDGTYGLLNATYCALLRCPDAGNCSDFIQVTHTAFTSFSLTASILPDFESVEPLAMVATNNTQVVSSRFYTVSASSNELQHSLNAPNFHQPLLSASLFIVYWNTSS